mmetsp:Transcript_34122/g.6150  ORF Transcript_34122/g.6150 Transcript_34122/m.6150 type:complete len:94 (-) Transcript_34122:158-439(-)
MIYRQLPPSTSLKGLLQILMAMSLKSLQLFLNPNFHNTPDLHSLLQTIQSLKNQNKIQKSTMKAVLLRSQMNHTYFHSFHGNKLQLDIIIRKI